MLKTIRETFWPTVRSDESFPELNRYSGVRMLLLGLAFLLVSTLVALIVDYGVLAAATKLWAGLAWFLAKLRIVETFLVTLHVHLGLFVLFGVVTLAGVVRASNAIYAIAMKTDRTTEDYERIRVLALSVNRQENIQLFWGFFFLGLSFVSALPLLFLLFNEDRAAHGFDVTLTIISIATFFVTLILPDCYRGLLAPNVRECKFVHQMLKSKALSSFNVDSIRDAAGHMLGNQKTSS